MQNDHFRLNVNTLRRLSIADTTFTRHHREDFERLHELVMEWNREGIRPTHESLDICVHGKMGDKVIYDRESVTLHLSGLTILWARSLGKRAQEHGYRATIWVHERAGGSKRCDLQIDPSLRPAEDGIREY